MGLVVGKVVGVRWEWKMRVVDAIRKGRVVVGGHQRWRG